MASHPSCIRFKKLFLLFFSFFCLCRGMELQADKEKITEPVCLYLTWQNHPESTMTINWVTPLDLQEDRIEYRQIGNGTWTPSQGTHSQLPVKTPYLLHRIELTQLNPDTAYEFRFGTDAAVYKFKTMPATLAHPIRFLAGGDMYHDDIETLRLTNVQAAKTSPQFALVGGDIAYASTKITDYLPRWNWIDYLFGQTFDRWLIWLAAWKEDMVTPEGYLIPILPAIGNHDTVGRYGQTPQQAPFFYTLFPMPGKPGYNVLDFSGYMSIFLLDSGHTNSIGGKQAEWIAKTMQERKEIPYKFALYHVPAYPSVHKFTTEISAEIRKFWVPSFDAYRLTAAFENHEHSYKRTHPLLGGMIADNGVIYVGDGGWGVKNPRRPRHTYDKPYLAKAISARHFLVVDVGQDKQTIHAVDSNGSVIDFFSWK